jgi:long-chain acyl-CoA synthetase
MNKRQDYLDLTIPQLLQLRAAEFGEKAALREKEMGVWRSYSWRSYLEMVRCSGLGLLALGFTRGDKLAILSDNIPETLFLSIGAQAVGGVSTAVYQTSLPEEIAGILDYLQATVVFCSDQEQVDKLVEVRPKLPRVARVIYEDPRGMREYGSDPWFMAVEELYRLGEERHRLDPQRFGELLAQGRPDEVCHLCLTSGTTGLPKGAMLTHRNYINMGLQLTEVDPLQESDEYLSFLPFAWIGEQMNSFGVAMVSGITVNFPESVETAMEDFREIGPHFMFGAPRIYEAIRAKIWLKINESYRFNRLLYNFFMAIGEKAAGYRMSGRSLPIGLGLMAWLGRQLMFRPLVNQIGFLRLRRAYTGGAALGPELFTFYQAIGVNLKQIYGQTEIVGIAYMHRDGDVRPDTVGKPLPGTECRITESGEILSRSLSVTPGYFELPEKTAELLEGGWLHSGDAGYIDAHGHLVVIDRLADVMHNRQGEMFSPMYLENRLKFSPYIKEAIVFGNRQDYVATLINIDPTVVGKWAEDRGISYSTYMDLSARPEVAELIHGEVARVNEAAEKPHFRIHRFAVLYKLLDMDDGELTKTGKIRRTFVTEKYQDLYQALYDETINEKHVSAHFQYQDGQTATVETLLRFHTVETT